MMTQQSSRIQNQIAKVKIPPIYNDKKTEKEISETPSIIASNNIKYLELTLA